MVENLEKYHGSRFQVAHFFTSLAPNYFVLGLSEQNGFVINKTL